MVSISSGNSKIGKIGNISLTPVKSCPKNVPCASRGNCYALKSYCMYKNVRAAWDGNLDSLNKDRDGYFADVSKWIKKNSPRFFRWHVAGDIVDQNYLDRMKRVAKQFPDTKFLAFTKNHSLRFANIPENLAIVLSMWPGMPKPKKNLPIAWLNDGKENRIPENAIECMGTCENCGMCWSLKTIGRDVYFNKH